MGIKHIVPAGLPTGTVSGKVAGDDWRADHVHVPMEILMFHAGVSANTTATTAAGTLELPTAPMSRHLTDLTYATQMRLVVGIKVIGAGGTSQDLRVQYSTNGATQTTWADLNASGTGLNAKTGTANTVVTAGWVNIAAGAIANDVYLRLATVTVGTMTTGATFSWAAVLFK